MTTSPLISHRLFVAALNPEKTKGPGHATTRVQLPAEVAAGARAGEARVSSGNVIQATHRSLVNAGLRLLRA